MIEIAELKVTTCGDHVTFVDPEAERPGEQQPGQERAEDQQRDATSRRLYPGRCRTQQISRPARQQSMSAGAAIGGAFADG